MKIYITGHKGLVGSALYETFKNKNYEVITSTKEQVNFLNKTQIDEFLKTNKPDVVILSAARVGGITYNINNPATMGYENGLITLNTLQSCHENNIKKVIYLGSSCIFPKECNQPMKEEYLLTGNFEPTNLTYALAKTFGIKMIEAYNKQYGYEWFSVQPCNITGPNDNFNKNNSHFFAANIRKIYEAKINKQNEILCWGTGIARRELLYSFDLAEAIEFLLNTYNDKSLINIGMGIDYSIKEYIETLCDIIGYNGKIVWDETKPNGMLQKLLDTTKINNLGWTYKTDMRNIGKKVFNWFLYNKGKYND